MTLHYHWWYCSSFHVFLQVSTLMLWVSSLYSSKAQRYQCVYLDTAFERSALTSILDTSQLLYGHLCVLHWRHLILQSLSVMIPHRIWQALKKWMSLKAILTSISFLIDLSLLFCLVVSHRHLILKEGWAGIVCIFYTEDSMSPFSLNKLISLINKHVLMLLILKFLQFILDLNILNILLLAWF